MASSVSMGRTDLSDVERDMLLLAIIGKSARQVAMTALRINVVKDVIIGNLTEFLLDHFSVDTVSQSDGDGILADDIGLSRSERVSAPDRCPVLPRVSGASARRSADSYGRVGHVAGGDAYIPVSSKSASSEALLSPDDSQQTEDVGGGSEAQPACAPVALHRRLLPSSRAQPRFDRSAQRRSYDAHTAPAMEGDPEEEDRVRRDSNGWPVSAKSADSAAASGDECGGRNMTSSQSRQFASSRDGGLEGMAVVSGIDSSIAERTRSSRSVDVGEAHGGSLRVPVSKSSVSCEVYTPSTAKLVTATGSSHLAVSSCSQVQVNDQPARHSNLQPGDHCDDSHWDSVMGERGPPSDAPAGYRREATHAYRSQDAAPTANQVVRSDSVQWYQSTRKRRSVLPPMPLSGYGDRAEGSVAAARSGAGGQLNYMCPECSKDFRRQSELNRHVKIVHRQEKPYRCDQCGIPFATRWNLKCHYNKQHAFQGQTLNPRSQAAISISDSFEDDAVREGGSSAGDAAMFDRDCPDGMVLVESDSASAATSFHAHEASGCGLLEAPSLKQEAGE